MSGYNKNFGAYGEQLAAEYLKKNRYKIMERNFCTPYGEIDIVAKDKKTVVFIEVKTRSSEKYGTGLDAINAKKRKTMLKCAEFYISAKRIKSPVRIDVISIDTSLAGGITHIKGALE